MQRQNPSTVIGESIVVEGQLSGDEDMTVLGRVEGSIDLSQTLFVASEGIVKADVRVANAVISGIVIGNVTAEQSVQITETGRLVGDLRAPRLVITAGARVRGQVDMGGTQGREDQHELAERRPAAASNVEGREQRQALALTRSATGRFQRLSLPQRRPMPAAEPILRREAKESDMVPVRAQAHRSKDRNATSSHKKTSSHRARRATGRRRD